MERMFSKKNNMSWMKMKIKSKTENFGMEGYGN